jgi:hypothetical protein
MFVVDTVGEIALPDGSKCQGVILAVPHGTSPDEARASMRSAAAMWSDRVTIKSVDDPAAEGDA